MNKEEVEVALLTQSLFFILSNSVDFEWHPNHSFLSEKSTNLDTRLVLFSTKSVFADGINHSLVDEICFADEIACGGLKTDLISSKPQGFDFIQIGLDFIVNKVNDFIKI